MLRANSSFQSVPELWGGIECTISRTHDGWFDQLSATGHYSRPSDIDLLAGLGITTLRYPILWERHQPERNSQIDWTWAEGQLNTIRRHGITPIAGLLHHGSGPAFTDLMSPTFADDFAGYAKLVATRFPWLEKYTPINEPLTTARFSGLYGHWYPHETQPHIFIGMLLNQLRGIVKAMKAIRSINPSAILIQTEDLAQVHSRPALAYQAVFENHRRWLTFDILCGRFDKLHPLWDYFSYVGITENELSFFIENPCIPDVMGLNYYVTSERFLDENLERYAPLFYGGNGRQAYVDAEAVRTIPITGLVPLLNEVWARYALPMAITEAHLNCTREDQMRWFKEIWDACCKAMDSGVDVRAVTAWALLGANDWDSLLTKRQNHYESGAFEIVSGKPHITAVGHLIRHLAAIGNCEHTLLHEPGWWHRLYQQLPRLGTGKESDRAGIKFDRAFLLIFASLGPLYFELRAACIARGIRFRRRSFPSKDLPKAFDPMPWGLISVVTSENDTQILIAVAINHSIPYMNYTGDIDINSFLNHFVDKSMELYCRQNLVNC